MRHPNYTNYDRKNGFVRAQMEREAGVCVCVEKSIIEYGIYRQSVCEKKTANTFTSVSFMFSFKQVQAQGKHIRTHALVTTQKCSNLHSPKTFLKHQSIDVPHPYYTP